MSGTLASNPQYFLQKGWLVSQQSRWIVFVSGLIASVMMTPSDADEWRKMITPAYTLNNKQDAIAFVDAANGWYGNGTGRVYRTIDSGDHWSLAWKHRGTYVRAIDFVDATFGVLGNVGPGYFPDVRDKQPLYVSRDGGSTWTPVTYDGPRVTGICAIDILRRIDGSAIIRAGGRVGGPAGMIVSEDGGATWRSRDMTSVTGMILDIKFVDAQTGFIAGASDANESRAHARILKTSDGGKTWRAVFESARGGDNNWKLAFPSKDVGYGTIISYEAPEGDARGYVVKTDDGGERWTPLKVTNDIDWIPYGITFADEMRGFVGGSTGGFETRDGGKSWTKVPIGLSVNKMRVVKMPDGHNRIFAIGESVYRGDLDLR